MRGEVSQGEPKAEAAPVVGGAAQHPVPGGVRESEQEQGAGAKVPSMQAAELRGAPLQDQ